MLSEYYLSVDDFQTCIRSCGQDLSKWENVNHIHRHRMSDLGHDMINFSENFVRAHINATMWLTDAAYETNKDYDPNPPNWEELHTFLAGESKLEHDVEETVKKHLGKSRSKFERRHRIYKSLAGKRSDQSAGELKACYKAYFFFIRAFHDACYGVLLNLSGSTPGDYSSMNRCISRKVAPIFSQISNIPGYIEWFDAFKTKRDNIKKGIGFSLCGPQWDVGVGFDRVTPEGGIVVDAGENGNNFRLGDLIASIEYSIAIVKLISEIVKSSNKPLE